MVTIRKTDTDYIVASTRPAKTVHLGTEADAVEVQKILKEIERLAAKADYIAAHNNPLDLKKAYPITMFSKKQLITCLRLAGASPEAVEVAQKMQKEELQKRYLTIDGQYHNALRNGVVYLYRFRAKHT